MSKPDTPRSDQRPASLKRLEAITGASFGKTHGQLSVYVVLDYSASMSEDSKMRQAKDGAREFAKKALESGYAVGLVQFATTPRRALTPQRTLDGFDTALNAWEPAGSTDMAEAIGNIVATLVTAVANLLASLVTAVAVLMLLPLKKLREFLGRPNQP